MSREYVTSSSCPWAAMGDGALSELASRQPQNATPEMRIPLERLRVGLMALPPSCWGPSDRAPEQRLCGATGLPRI